METGTLLCATLVIVTLETVPMSDELAPQRGGGRELCNIFSKNMSTSHPVSLALVMYVCSDSATALFSCDC